MASPTTRQPPALCAGQHPTAGRVPYGYQLSKREGEVALEPDPLTAPVVRRIFREYVNGSGFHVIAERLTADGILRPSAYDPQRNPHHQGNAWSKQVVRSIITNGRYADQQTAYRDCADWTDCDRRCAEHASVALVPSEVYRRTQDILAMRGGTRGGRPREQSESQYLLRGLLRCGLCQRLMQGTRNNDAPYYRCRFPREYARANGIDHPVNVYVREDRLVHPLLDWVRRSLPSHLRDWAEGQPPGVQTRLVERVQGVRELLGDARRHSARHGELLGMLSMRLVYEHRRNVVRVTTEVLRGAVVEGVIAL